MKEYQFNLHPLEGVQIAVNMTLRSLEGGAPVEVQQVIPIGDNIYRPLLDSYREGDDARDVFADSIEWWEAELAAIDKQVLLSP